jgi:hypothetical protein
MSSPYFLATSLLRPAPAITGFPYCIGMALIHRLQEPYQKSRGNSRGFYRQFWKQR